jgi:hypothetical protein
MEAGLHGDHEGVDLADQAGEAAAVALLQELGQVFLEEVRVLLVAVAGKVQEGGIMVARPEA